MDYTTSDAHIVHGPTGNRMHQVTNPVTTQVSDVDMNQVTWSLMEILAAAGVAPATFDPNTPATYQRLRDALNALYPARASTPTISSMAAAIAASAASTEASMATKADLTAATAQTKHLWSKLRSNQSDVRIMIVGDSTGNEPTEWVYLMAQWLATQCPTHTVKYRLFSEGSVGGSNAWGGYSTLQTGSGAMPPDTGQNTIWVDNASVGGINTFYYQGAREAVVWDGSDYDLVISNFGHNLGTAMTEETALPEWVVALSHLRLMAPRAGLLVTLQNPRSSTTSDINTNGSAQSARMVSAWRKAADLVGASVIDVYSAFKAHPNYASLMADETHPSAAGSAVWLDEVKRVMAEPARLTGDVPRMFNPLAEVRPNYAPNPRFSRWTGATPDGWAFTNCTPVKNVGVTDGTLYSMEVQIGAGVNPKITTDLTSFLPHLKGKICTLLVRIWRPSTVNLLTGRIAIETTDSVINPAFTSYPRGASSSGGWEWAIATLMIPRNVSSAQLRIYAGAADGSDSGKSFYVDHVWFGEGVLPGGVGFDDANLKTVADYYNDANAGRLIGNTGTLTAAGGTLTLTGAPVGFSDTYINLPGLTPGKIYKVQFNCSSATGNTAGGCYMRNGFDGGSTDLAKASGTGDWVAGGGVVSFTFVAPNGPVSVRPYGYTGTTGYVMSGWSIVPAESGIAVPSNFTLTDMRVDSGALVQTAGSGVFGLVSAVGSALYVQAGGVVGGTATANGFFEVAVPADYVAGRSLTLTVNALADGAGTLGATKTITVTAYRISTSGVFGSNLGPAAQTLTKTAADYALTIAGATLSPGDRMQFRISMAVQESGGSSTLAPRINSVRLS